MSFLVLFTGGTCRVSCFSAALILALIFYVIRVSLLLWFCFSPVGGAGASCVESLRQAGYTGRVILATREPHLPYDRPKLSKALEMPVEKLLLRSKDFYNVSLWFSSD